MQAICFKCGNNKSSPLKMCGSCHEVPKTESDQVLSLCLSVECVKPETLARCRKYFRKKQKPPRFKENIVNLATLLLDEQASNSHSNNSLEFSSSLFEFPDLQAEEMRKPVETVTAHIIGKGPRQDEDDGSATLGKKGHTYHTEQWEVGRDISEEQYKTARDPMGNIYVWYRWINNRWTWTCIGKLQFEQLKSVEMGRSFS